jgi:hypothetical protein
VAALKIEAAAQGQLADDGAGGGRQRPVVAWACPDVHDCHGQMGLAPFPFFQDYFKPKPKLTSKFQIDIFPASKNHAEF